MGNGLPVGDVGNQGQQTETVAPRWSGLGRPVERPGDAQRLSKCRATPILAPTTKTRQGTVGYEADAIGMQRLPAKRLVEQTR